MNATSIKQHKKKVFNASFALKSLLALAVIINGFVWLSVRNEQTRWLNVPPAPSVLAASFSGLGDLQLAYRLIGLTVQNMGDTGGRIVNLKEYDTHALSQWFHLEHALDERSNFIPYLAGYFFTGRKDNKNLEPIIEYLEVAAKTDAPYKWRWLVQAVFLAMHKLEDTDRALELAYKLAKLDDPDMPAWAKQMPAFVLNSKGEKADALMLMLNIMKTQGENMEPEELYSLKYYVCNEILSPEENEKFDFCGDI